jgi:hypothetical protein
LGTGTAAVIPVVAAQAPGGAGAQLVGRGASTIVRRRWWLSSVDVCEQAAGGALVYRAGWRRGFISDFRSASRSWRASRNLTLSYLK